MTSRTDPSLSAELCLPVFPQQPNTNVDPDPAGGAEDEDVTAPAGIEWLCFGELVRASAHSCSVLALVEPEPVCQTTAEIRSDLLRSGTSPPPSLHLQPHHQGLVWDGASGAALLLQPQRLQELSGRLQQQQQPRRAADA